MTDLFNTVPKGRTSFFCFDSLLMGCFQPSVCIVTTLLRGMQMLKCTLRDRPQIISSSWNDLLRSPCLPSHSGQPKEDTESSSQSLSGRTVTVMRNCFPFSFIFPPASMVCGVSPTVRLRVIQNFLAAAALALSTRDLAQSQGRSELLHSPGQPPRG